MINHVECGEESKPDVIPIFISSSVDRKWIKLNQRHIIMTASLTEWFEIFSSYRKVLPGKGGKPKGIYQNEILFNINLSFLFMEFWAVLFSEGARGRSICLSFCSHPGHLSPTPANCFGKKDANALRLARICPGRGMATTRIDQCINPYLHSHLDDYIWLKIS